MPVLPVMCEAGRGLVKVDGQGAVDGVTGGKERKALVKRAFRGVCPCQVLLASIRKATSECREYGKPLRKMKNGAAK